jgi:hypothetical protein
MVLGQHREALVGGVEARSLGNGPALEDAVDLQPEIVVETARGVFLDSRTWSLPASAAGRPEARASL